MVRGNIKTQVLRICQSVGVDFANDIALVAQDMIKTLKELEEEGHRVQPLSPVGPTAQAYVDFNVPGAANAKQFTDGHCGRRFKQVYDKYGFQAKKTPGFQEKKTPYVVFQTYVNDIRRALRNDEYPTQEEIDAYLEEDRADRVRKSRTATMSKQNKDADTFESDCLMKKPLDAEGRSTLAKILEAYENNSAVYVALQGISGKDARIIVRFTCKAVGISGRLDATISKSLIDSVEDNDLSKSFHTALTYLCGTSNARGYLVREEKQIAGPSTSSTVATGFEYTLTIPTDLGDVALVLPDSVNVSKIAHAFTLIERFMEQFDTGTGSWAMVKYGPKEFRLQRIEPEENEDLDLEVADSDPYDCRFQLAGLLSTLDPHRLRLAFVKRTSPLLRHCPSVQVSPSRLAPAACTSACHGFGVFCGWGTEKCGDGFLLEELGSGGLGRGGEENCLADQTTLGGHPFDVVQFQRNGQVGALRRSRPAFEASKLARLGAIPACSALMQARQRVRGETSRPALPSLDPEERAPPRLFSLDSSLSLARGGEAVLMGVTESKSGEMLVSFVPGSIFTSHAAEQRLASLYQYLTNNIDSPAVLERVSYDLVNSLQLIGTYASELTMRKETQESMLLCIQDLVDSFPVLAAQPGIRPALDWAWQDGGLAPLDDEGIRKKVATTRDMVDRRTKDLRQIHHVLKTYFGLEDVRQLQIESFTTLDSSYGTTALLKALRTAAGLHGNGNPVLVGRGFTKHEVWARWTELLHAATKSGEGNPHKLTKAAKEMYGKTCEELRLLTSRKMRTHSPFQVQPAISSSSASGSPFDDTATIANNASDPLFPTFPATPQSRPDHRLHAQAPTTASAPPVTTPALVSPTYSSPPQDHYLSPTNASAVPGSVVRPTSTGQPAPSTPASTNPSSSPAVCLDSSQQVDRSKSGVVCAGLRQVSGGLGEGVKASAGAGSPGWAGFAGVRQADEAAAAGDAEEGNVEANAGEADEGAGVGGFSEEQREGSPSSTSSLSDVDEELAALDATSPVSSDAKHRAKKRRFDESADAGATAGATTAAAQLRLLDEGAAGDEEGKEGGEADAEAERTGVADDDAEAEVRGSQAGDAPLDAGDARRSTNRTGSRRHPLKATNYAISDDGEDEASDDDSEYEMPTSCSSRKRQPRSSRSRPPSAPTHVLDLASNNDTNYSAYVDPLTGRHPLDDGLDLVKLVNDGSQRLSLPTYHQGIQRAYSFTVSELARAGNPLGDMMAPFREHIKLPSRSQELAALALIPESAKDRMLMHAQDLMLLYQRNDLLAAMLFDRARHGSVE
uniref:BY PROTMAP: gi/342319325/gb/EGU11274.1/ Proteophosphoglycan ppg4 [Rhodotorula glutinis ATCC 204091] n=1 Tax=Rhodotorula toruloides TaxID=5286 RepID=A0A0K3C7B0_RHOTO